MDDPLPVPSPRMVRAARAHLARRYGRGVEALLWEAHDYPLPDVDAVRKAIAAMHVHYREHADGASSKAETEQSIEAMDLGAALVVLQAARLDLDRLEVDLIDTVREAGLDWAAIAAVLELPDAAAAERRYARLRPRLDAPVDHVVPPEAGDAPPSPAR